MSLKSNFFLLKLLAGMSWIALFLYTKDYPPGAIPEGSSVHIAILMILIGLGLAIPLAGLGREFQKQRNYSSKFESGMETTGGFHLSVPRWMQGSSSRQAEEEQRIEFENESYRAQFHKALNPREQRGRR
jgi:hypothetical protein